MAEHQSVTPGGEQLRKLRLERDRTQLWVELEAELGTGYLQRLESGRVRQPERQTLERILTALEPSYNSRTYIMQLYGYVVTTEPPNDDELAWAKNISRPQMEEFPFPAYALDCLHRLVAWNDSFPWLLGLSPEDVSIEELEGKSMLKPWFDAGSALGRLVVDPESFLPSLIRAFRYEHQRFATSSWAEDLLNSLLEQPLFQYYWNAVIQEPVSVSAARALVPLSLLIPGTGKMKFRLSSEPFLQDVRFRIVYYFPDDLRTMKASKRTPAV